MYQEDAGAGEQRRAWHIDFRHDGVPLSTGRCTLSAAAGRASPAMLGCEGLPSSSALRFEPFTVSEEAAVQQAIAAVGLRPGRVDTSRVYSVEGGVARARYQVIVFDGQQEDLALVSGSGEVIAAGSNEKGFSFTGFDLDYIAGSYGTQVTPFPVGADQTKYLDSAPYQSDPSCTNPSDNGGIDNPPSGYHHGFIVCHNDTLEQANIPVAAPRADEDFTNAPGGGDVFGPQELWLSQEQLGVKANGFLDVPAVPRPTDPRLDTEYIYLKDGDKQPVAPAHEAELQAFYNVGKLEKFYHLLLPPALADPGPPAVYDFSKGMYDEQGQDRFRLEITVHWTGLADSGYATYNTSHGARYFLGIEDFGRIDGYQTPPHIFDGTSDGFLFAHEYHHHIQEHLARLNHWALYPNQSVLFPAGGVQCDSATGCRRRQILTEGLADAFGAVATGRPFGGTLSLDTESFPLDPCFPEDSYGGGALPGGLLGGNGTHVLCTDIAFGNWALDLNDHSGCGPGSGAISSAHDPRRAFVLSGALWQYFTWFRDAGMSKIVPARHMIRAEAALTETTSGEVDYLNALVDYLMSLDAVANRRYVHLARAAFAEKGVFLKTLHQYKNGSGYEDAPLRPRCDAGSCSNSDSRQLLGGALTAAGPIDWKQGDASGPEFRGFVVPGTRFENKGFYTAVGHLDLSTDPSFPAGSTVSQEIDVGTDSQHDLINCSPPGFFYATVPAATYNVLSDAAVTAASASGAEPRVYYRLRECFTDGACANTTSVVSAYTVITPTGSTGCAVTCAVGAPRSGRTGRVPGLLAAVLGLGLFGVRRRSLGRRWRQERQPCAAC